MLWPIQQWQKPGQALHLALDITVLWNRFCVVVLSMVCHGRAIPLPWQTLEHPSARVSAEAVIALLECTERPPMAHFESTLDWRQFLLDKDNKILDRAFQNLADFFV